MFLKIGKAKPTGRPCQQYVGLLLLLLSIFLIVTLLASGCGGGVETGDEGVPAESAGVSEQEPATIIEEEPGDESNFSFIVCGDPQNNYEVFGKILEASKFVDFLIIAGDMTGSGTATEFSNFVNLMNNSKIPYYCVPGNHDVATAPVDDLYRTYMGQPFQSFDYENSHFVLIDNSTPELGFYPAEQEWVKSDLQQANEGDYDHIFAVCHVPPNYPYSLGNDASQIQGMNANDQLVPILSKGRVEELFCGHVHTYLEYQEDGLSVIITGGAGAPLTKWGGGESFHHYVRVDIEGKQRRQEVVRI